MNLAMKAVPLAIAISIRAAKFLRAANRPGLQKQSRFQIVLVSPDWAWMT
jgi:hypothetical protein